MCSTVEADKVSIPYYKCSEPPSDLAWLAGRSPIQDGHWLESPTIYVCKGTPIKESRVRRAISYWKRLGYSVNGPIMQSEIPACYTGNYKPGAIVIDIPGQSFDLKYSAMTRAYRQKKTREIVGARIEIQASWCSKERVLEHEMGHAFGWGHIRRQYHIMHPEHEHGGSDSYGLKNKFPVCFNTDKSYAVEEIVYFD